MYCYTGLNVTVPYNAASHIKVNNNIIQNPLVGELYSTQSL